MPKGSRKSASDWDVLWPLRETSTFEEYIADFKYIFLRADEERDVLDVFLNVIKHTSRIAEAVRRVQPNQVALALSDVMAWLLTFMTKMNEEKKAYDRDILLTINRNLSQAIWMKYPYRCSVCFGGLFQDLDIIRKLEEIGENINIVKKQGYEKYAVLEPNVKADKLAASLAKELAKYSDSNLYLNCKCLAISITETEDRTVESTAVPARILRITEDNKKRLDLAKKLVRRKYSEEVSPPQPWTLCKIEQMFKNIYGNNVERVHLEEIANHLQEEVGEIAAALTNMYTYHVKYFRNPGKTELNRRAVDLTEEVADTVSWAFSCLFKINESFRAAHQYKLAVLRSVEEGPYVDLHMGDIIWAGWGQRTKGPEKYWHLCCGECSCDDICNCGWEFALTKITADAIKQRD